MKKRLVSLLLIIVMLASVFSVGIIAVAAADDEIEIQLLATSDMHGKFYPHDYALNEESTSGSLAQVAAIIEKYRNDNTIVADVGDTIQGNSAELFLDDPVHPMIQGLNDVGYDLFVPGNHEFNFGVDVLERTFKQFKGKSLLANVYDKSDKRLADAYTITEVAGVKIAFIGLVTPNITRWDSMNLKDYKVENPLESVKKALAEIEGKADVIVGLFHMSEESEYGVKGSGVNDIADEFPQIDVIVAAHEHKQVEGADRNGVLIVENRDSGQTVAKVNITVKKNAAGKYEVINKISESIVTADVEASDKIIKSLSTFNDRAIADASTVIGELVGRPLVEKSEIEGIPQGQIEDSALAQFINTVQMHYTDADISAAAIFDENANMQPGTIKKSDTSLIYKFTNTLYKLEMTGKQLKKYMEWSASYFNTYQPGDLTVSFNPDVRIYNFDIFDGVKYDINVANKPGSRIENLTKLDGTPVTDTDVFTVAVNNYRANSHLLQAGTVFEEGEDLPKLLEIDVKGEIGGIRELIGDYIIKDLKGVLKSEKDDNWKLIGNDWNAENHKEIAGFVNSGKITIQRSEDGRTPNIKSLTETDLAVLKAEDNAITSTIVEEGTEVYIIDDAA